MRTARSTDETKILPSPTSSDSRSVSYRRNDLVRLPRGDHKINPDLRHKADCVLGAAINLRVPLLSAESLDLSHGHASHAEKPSARSAPSSSLNGLIMAVTSFIAYRPFLMLSQGRTTPMTIPASNS